MARAPIEGIPWGTVLPSTDFPKDFKCPWCPDRLEFRTAQGLRGHAANKHGIQWGKIDYESLPEDAYRKTVSRIWNEDGEIRLQPWHMLGIAMVEIQGMSWEQATRNLGRKDDKKLIAAAGAPEGQAFTKVIREKFKDPEAVARLLVQAQAADATVDFLMALQWAKDAHDYDAVHRMTKDLLKANNIFEADVIAGPQVTQIFLTPGQTLDTPEIKTTWKEIPKLESVDVE